MTTDLAAVSEEAEGLLAPPPALKADSRQVGSSRDVELQALEQQPRSPTSAGRGLGDLPSSPPLQRVWNRELASLRPAALLGRLPPPAVYRSALQMFVALFCATLYATSESVHTLFRGKGLWAAITVTLALETNVGATWRKSTLRAMGTLLGGALGSLCVALTGILCGGWVPGAPASKVLAMAFMVASCGSCVQYMRAHDPGKRDYAFQTCVMTMVLTSLSNFADGDSDQVLLSVALRLVTIVIGGLLALAVSLLIAPEYASQASQNVLAKALREAEALLTAVIREHGNVHRRIVMHPHLHSMELRLAALLERYTIFVSQASEEKRLRLGPRLVDAERADAAGAAARGLFTGAVSMLHVLESAPRSEEEAGMYALHSAALAEVSEALSSLLERAAVLCEVQGDAAEVAAENACAALRILDGALGGLLEATQASAQGAGAGSPAVREAHRDFTVLVFALQDAGQCCARIVSNNLPEASGLDSHLSAQQTLKRERAHAMKRLHNIRRSLSHVSLT